MSESPKTPAQRDRSKEHRRRTHAAPHVSGLRGASLPLTARVFLVPGATDLRPSVDGLAALVQVRFGFDPLSAAISSSSASVVGRRRHSAYRSSLTICHLLHPLDGRKVPCVPLHGMSRD